MAVKLGRLHCRKNVGWVRLRLNDLLLSPHLRRRAFCVWLQAYVSHYARVAFAVSHYVSAYNQASWIRVVFDQIRLTSLSLAL